MTSEQKQVLEEITKQTRELHESVVLAAEHEHLADVVVSGLRDRRQHLHDLCSKFLGLRIAAEPHNRGRRS